MNVLEILMTVLKCAIILMDHFSVAVTVDTVSPVIGNLVQMSMNATLEYTTANRTAQTLLVDLHAVVMLDFSSIPTRERAMVILRWHYPCMHALKAISGFGFHEYIDRHACMSRHWDDFPLVNVWD